MEERETACFKVNNRSYYKHVPSAAILDLAGAGEPLNRIGLRPRRSLLGSSALISNSSLCSRAGQIQDGGRRDKARNKLFHVLLWLKWELKRIGSKLLVLQTANTDCRTITEAKTLGADAAQYERRPNCLRAYFTRCPIWTRSGK